MHNRDDSEIIEELRKIGGTDRRLLDNAELLPIILSAARCDYKANETYVWSQGPLLSCPITAMAGDSDPHVTIQEAEAWRAHCSNDFTLHIFPGGHFYLDACKPDVANIVSSVLKRIR